MVQSPSADDSSLAPGGSFTLSVSVRNQGHDRSDSTTLRYYRSTDSTISTSDTQLDTDGVSRLDQDGTSPESVTLVAPATAGTYYYGACVDAVDDESDTTNNCSSSVSVTVSANSGSSFSFIPPWSPVILYASADQTLETSDDDVDNSLTNWNWEAFLPEYL